MDFGAKARTKGVFSNKNKTGKTACGGHPMVPPSTRTRQAASPFCEGGRRLGKKGEKEEEEERKKKKKRQ